MTLRQGLKLSAFFHGGLLIFLIIQALFSRKFLPHETPLLRVDLVALPDYTRQELLKMRETKQKQAASVTEEPTKKNRIENALTRMRALRKFSESPAEAPPVIKGNIVTAGTSLSEQAKETGVSSYKDLIQDKLEAKFSVPVWLERLQPSAVVQIWLDATGAVLRQEFIRKSDHPQYDQIVLRTIQSAQPFDPPPKELRDALRDQGIEIQFPLR